MRKVSMKKINEVLRLHFCLDLSLRKSALVANISNGTASNYIKRFKELKIDIDSFLALNELEQEKLFYPADDKVYAILSHKHKVMPDYVCIHQELKKKKQTKVTLALLHEEYQQTYGEENSYRYTQFREYYSRFLKKINPSMKQTYYAGEKLFVDYSGLTMPIVNKKTGEIRDFTPMFPRISQISFHPFH